MYIWRAIASLLLAFSLVLLAYFLAMQVENAISNMTGDLIAAWLFLLAGAVAPLVIYLLYGSLLHAPHLRMKHIKCSILGALVAAVCISIVGGVVGGSQGGDVGEAALYGAMIYLGFFGIPAAVVGAVVGAVLSIFIQRNRKASN